jgi:putative transposase
VNIYPFIEAEKAGDHNVKRACESLQVSRAAYYTAHRPALCPGLCRCRADRADQGLHAQSKGRYGAPWIHAELRAAASGTARSGSPG